MATAAGAKKAQSHDFPGTFKALRDILKPYEPKLKAAHDTSRYYYLETKDPMYRGRPLMFAAVRSGKAYVSFHLIPLYACPELGKAMSPALKKRMQGKSCLNFTTVDPELFKELADLTKAGFQKFTTMKMPWD